jgi:hypothetical protein
MPLESAAMAEAKRLERSHATRNGVSAGVRRAPREEAESAVRYDDHEVAVDGRERLREGGRRAT